MNNEPLLTVFEPSKEPRTIKLQLTEDTESDSAVTIYDENGCKVTDYKVLYDETQSPVDTDKEKIISYIKDWESQGNSVNEKQARKIEKRKRIQEKRKLKRERNKKRKMKSLIHCNYDSNPLANAKDVQEERALLRAMKTQKNRLKNVFNIKPNRIINCNTNVRPFENSTIEIGTRKKPIDVVVLDSDEEIDSDSDDIQINIDTPQLVRRRNRPSKNFTNDCSFGSQNSFVISTSTSTSTSTTTRRRKKQVDIVQIVDSSDSDVECISCEEFIESLSDDDDDDGDNSSTAKKPRSGDTNVRNKSAPNSDELICIPEDTEANEELASLVDSFVNKYIQTALPPLPEILPDAEFDASQILISEPISLQPKLSPPATSLSEKTANSTAQLLITGSISLQPGDPRVAVLEKAAPAITISEPDSPQSVPRTRNKSKQSPKQVTFISTVDEKETNDDELVIIENELSDNESLIRDLIDEPVESDPAIEHEECHDSSDDWDDVEISSNDNLRTLNVIEFDSIPSPDYTPFDSIPATASNLQAFAAFVKSREKQDSNEINKSDVSEVSDEELPVILEESVKSTPKASTRSSPPLERRSPESNKNSGAPWRKRSQDTSSNEVHVVQHSPAIRKQSTESPKKRDRTPPWEEIQVIEPFTANRRKPWEKRACGEFKQSQPAQHSAANENRCSAQYCQTRSTSETRQSEKPYQVNSDNREYRRNTFSNPRYSRRPYQSHQRNALPPTNSASLEFLDKNSIRIGDPEPESEKSTKLKSTIVSVEHAQRKVSPKISYEDGRDRESNEPYHSDNSQNRPFHRKYPPEWSNTPDEVWEIDPPYGQKECECNAKKSQECDKSAVQDDDQYVRNAQPFKRCNSYSTGPYENKRFAPERKRFHQEPYEEQKFTPKRNRYHPEAYEEDKFHPNSRFNNDRKIPWRNNQTNRDGTNQRGHFRRNDQYYNRQKNYNENDFNQSNRYQKYPSNQYRRYDNRYPQNQRYPQRQTSSSSYSSNYDYKNQSQTQSWSSSSSFHQTRSSQTQTQNTTQEALFTRRPEKFNYKANVDDFDDHDDRHEQQSCYQVESYELNVAQKLQSGLGDEIESSWENKVASDFVPVNSNASVASPPWHSDSSNSNSNYRTIKAISRRDFINDKINTRK
ncbi:uncharacterized protein LOC135848131 [Planococcus citri]|uniref:uncharacterized protein LOC135848131 n=1 Tax=Planococcus citri TaxID=170843 RepID=UPI0031F8ACAF